MQSGLRLDSTSDASSEENASGILLYILPLYLIRIGAFRAALSIGDGFSRFKKPKNFPINASLFPQSVTGL